MDPTEDQIRRAAYDHWRRRGGAHGFDRDDWFAAVDELTFALNYQSIVEYPLDPPGPLVLSDRPARHCRFCERTAMKAMFGPARPVVDGGLESSLYTDAVCEDCQSTFRNALAMEFRLFQAALLKGVNETTSGEPPRYCVNYSVAAFKSLVACALVVMPAGELRYFVDTLEWVSNPDPQRDSLLLRGEATCLAYSANFLRGRSWTSLARRTDNSAPFPYMIFFLAQGGVVLQIQMPLCVRDLDLDGRPVRPVRRSFNVPDNLPFDQMRRWELRLGGGLVGLDDQQSRSGMDNDIEGTRPAPS